MSRDFEFPTSLDGPTTPWPRESLGTLLARLRRTQLIDHSRILVKLVSTALTGFFYVASRQRVGNKINLIKYDPVSE